MSTLGNIKGDHRLPDRHIRAQRSRPYLRLSENVAEYAVRIADFGAILAATAVAYFASAASEDPNPRIVPWDMAAALCAALIFVLLAERRNLYALKKLHDLDQQVRATSLLWLVTAGLSLFALLLIGNWHYLSRGWAVLWVVFGSVFLIGLRCLEALIIARCVRLGLFARRVAVVGTGTAGERLLASLRHSDEAVRVTGVFDDRLRDETAKSVAGYPVMGALDELIAYARADLLDEVIIAIPVGARRRLRMVLRRLRTLPVDIRFYLPSFDEELLSGSIGEIGPLRVLNLSERPLKNWDAILKWIEDYTLAGLLLVALFPLLVVIALAIKLDSRGPVLFRQERFGFNNNVIRVFKFRTMYVDCGDPTGAEATRPDDARVTRVGRVLRAWSLDELPQLFNVIKGDMSVIGPRPHAVAMRVGNDLYGDALDEYFARHRVKPGISGWAQVNGLRGQVDTIEKATRRLEHDLHYIENWSLWTDMKIILRTLWAVVTGRGAY